MRRAAMSHIAAQAIAMAKSAQPANEIDTATENMTRPKSG
jgi:hypothetical protein